jgi:hypothetical protein
MARSPLTGRTTIAWLAWVAEDFNIYALSGSRLIEGRSLAIDLVEK